MGMAPPVSLRAMIERRGRVRVVQAGGLQAHCSQMRPVQQHWTAIRRERSVHVISREAVGILRNDDLLVRQCVSDFPTTTQVTTPATTITMPTTIAGLAEFSGHDHRSEDRFFNRCSSAHDHFATTASAGINQRAPPRRLGQRCPTFRQTRSVDRGIPGSLSHRSTPAGRATAPQHLERASCCGDRRDHLVCPATPAAASAAGGPMNESAPRLPHGMKHVSQDPPAPGEHPLPVVALSAAPRSANPSR